MRIESAPREARARAYTILGKRAAAAGEPLIRYLDLGVRVVRLICHSAAFLHHVERQMACSLKERAAQYDATLIIWQEHSVQDTALALLAVFDRQLYTRLRLKRLQGHSAGIEGLVVHDEAFERHFPLIDVNPDDGSVTAWEPEGNTYYYAVENLEPEEFIKRGHIFVQTLFRICRLPQGSLVHGAVVGLNGIGVLLCAFGYRGKSTLCVNALLDGFEYVSDDYLILGKTDCLRAWPIYSIVALSPQAYSAMFDSFNGKFLSNNARKDKYMFSIAAYHDRFRFGYPVKLCMFPHICACGVPSIEPGYRETCVNELAFSTLNNTGDQKDAMTIGKLYSFVMGMPTYRFNLSRNITANTRCLREFLETWAPERPNVH